MLHTNSKKAKENVMAWIREDLDYLIDRLDNDNGVYNLDNDNGICAYIKQIFHEEYHHEIIRYGGQTAFIEWASGLPLGGMFDYYWNVSAVDLLGEILEETETEKARYTESEAEELLTKLIYREVTERAARYL